MCKYSQIQNHQTFGTKNTWPVEVKWRLLMLNITLGSVIALPALIVNICLHCSYQALCLASRVISKWVRWPDLLNSRGQIKQIGNCSTKQMLLTMTKKKYKEEVTFIYLFNQYESLPGCQKQEGVREGEKIRGRRWRGACLSLRQLVLELPKETESKDAQDATGFAYNLYISPPSTPPPYLISRSNMRQVLCKQLLHDTA